MVRGVDIYNSEDIKRIVGKMNKSEFDGIHEEIDKLRNRLADIESLMQKILGFKEVVENAKE